MDTFQGALPVNAIFFFQSYNGLKNLLNLIYVGPTSFAPVIDAAIGIVEKSNWQYHVLVIIADGQVVGCALFVLSFISPYLIYASFS